MFFNQAIERKKGRTTNIGVRRIVFDLLPWPLSLVIEGIRAGDFLEEATSGPSCESESESESEEDEFEDDEEGAEDENKEADEALSLLPEEEGMCEFVRIDSVARNQNENSLLEFELEMESESDELSSSFVGAAIRPPVWLTTCSSFGRLARALD